MRKFVLAAKKVDWLNLRLTGNFGDQNYLKYYLAQFYLDLNTKKCLILANKASAKIVLKNAGTFALEDATIGIGVNFRSMKKVTDVTKVISPINFQAVVNIFKALGADSVTATKNVSIILKGLYRLCTVLVNKTPALEKSLKMDPEQTIKDYMAYVLLGPKAKITTRSVVRELRKYKATPDGTEDTALKQVEGKKSAKKMGTFGIGFDLEGLRANPRDPLIVRAEVMVILNNYRKMLKKSGEVQRVTLEFLKGKNYEKTWENRGDLGLRSIEQEYPITNFEKFAEQVGGRDVATFLIVTNERMVTNMRNIRIAADFKNLGKDVPIYNHRRGDKTRSLGKERLREYYRKIDFNQFRPKPWMLHYATVKDLRLFETMYKIVSDGEIKLDILKQMQLLTGKKFQTALENTVLTLAQYKQLGDKEKIKLFKLSDAEIFRICKKAITTEFKREFLSGKLYNTYSELKTSFGPLALRESKFLLDEDSTLPLLTMKYAEEWNEKKVSWQDYLESLLPKDKDEVIKVTEKKDADVKVTEAALKKFMSYGHGVDLEVVKVWDIEIKDDARRFLVNNVNNPDLKIIKDGFHGTATSAASSILMSGFRLKGTMRTARSMGDVLYIAPNIDKSLQYIGQNFGRAEGATGIIFHGDLAVLGHSVSDAGDLKKGTNWTLTANRFATQEIGLQDANVQYILHHAYLVRRVHINSSTYIKTIDERTKFKAKIDLKPYLEEKGLFGDQAETPKLTLKTLRDNAQKRKIAKPPRTPL